ncbi:MAG: ribosome silencing factor [Selenomonadaceae bacterium]|nr:ribosome silencing factor [Selenomonadaceae bacterium]
MKDPTEICKIACHAASEKKARDIVVLDMREISLQADFFVICSANTATQVRAIVDNIEEKLEESEVKLSHREGYQSGEWVLLDFGDVVAHVFKTDAREFYSLEKLWSDAPLEHYED